ncbi:MAG: TIGR00730 family Rossman fold protein [Helicobacter sp.]|nr:TIGR00730 family Rossman fold protein [Helicobacter sp.]
MQKLLKGVEEVSHSLKILEPYSNIISVFGGTRIGVECESYQRIEQLAFELGKEGYSIMTGGGSGAMEAANKGLVRSKVKNPKVVSIGLNIELPCEQSLNPYVEIPLSFENFFSRKTIFNRCGSAFIVVEGGFGTMDELSEILVQVATQKIPKKPIILYDRNYWQELFEWFKKKMLKKGLITQEELNLLEFADTPKEVLGLLKSAL